MPKKELESLNIQLNNGFLIEIKQNQYRKAISQANDKYKDILQKFKAKLKELTSATNEN